MSHTPFMETQFPLSILSAESYKERKAGSGQTLTGLGKWWGRKPLVLARAVIVGLLMSASDNPEKDREVYLRILTMDEDGLRQRKQKSMSAAEVAARVSAKESSGLLDRSGTTPKWAKGVDKKEKERLERTAFNRLGYEEKLKFCLRPEQIEGPSEESWRVINEHLRTNAQSLQDLLGELSERIYGHPAKVGDVFCGGGSIPFEAARLGLEAYGSDLNPVAALLTWASIHLIGGGEEVQREVSEAQRRAWEEADRQITEWGIEHDGEGNRADAYLYCVEVKSPATGLWIPLAPSWVISEKYNVFAELHKNEERGGYDIEIVTGASDKQMKRAKTGTVQGGEVVCPETGNRYSMQGLRGPNGLRLWENDDLVPRPEDTLQERLYCVRWVTPEGKRLYKSVSEADQQREEKVLSLLKERFHDWQAKGYIPSKKIPPGVETSRLFRERGWIYWHHLFHPRQLLVHGLLIKFLRQETDETLFIKTMVIFGILNDFNCKMTTWRPQLTKSGGAGTIDHAFSNQALNTVVNPPCLGALRLKDYFIYNKKNECINNSVSIDVKDARDVQKDIDLWLTDPPYADAINYHELGDFFLAWYEKHLPQLFPEWSVNSRPALAVKGTDEEFKRSMVDIYANLAHHMPDNGFQVIMFTHQDSGVWADLGMILWAAGLTVTAAWTIGTETSSGLKTGNYVQGTVFMVLRKRLEEETVYLDELYPMVEDEVKAQIDHMRQVDDDMRPQFGDTDYQLGAYAAALRVLTSYSDIEGQDIKHELFRVRKKGEMSPFEQIIERAISIAASYLVPRDIDSHVWRNLTNYERLYLRGLELERHGELRNGAYMELARGFGVQEYKFFYGDSGANQARFKTPTEFKRTQLGDGEWGSSLMRHILFAVHTAAKSENPKEGLNYLKSSRKDYWPRREDIQVILKFLEKSSMYSHLDHWKADGESAQLLRALVENDYGGSV